MYSTFGLKNAFACEAPDDISTSSCPLIVIVFVPSSITQRNPPFFPNVPLSAIISSARTHILLPTDSTAHSTMPHKIPTAALIPSIRRCRTALSCLRLSRLPLSAASICFLPPFFVFTLLPIHTKTLNFLYSTTPPFCQYHSAIFHHKRMNASSYKLRRYCKHICGVKLFCALHSPQKITLLPLDKRFGNGYTYRAVHFKA